MLFDMCGKKSIVRSMESKKGFEMQLDLIQKLKFAQENLKHFQAQVDSLYAQIQENPTERKTEMFLAACKSRDLAVSNLARFFKNCAYLGTLQQTGAGHEQ